MKGDIVLNMVNNLNQNGIAFPGNDSRPRKLPIHCHNALCLAQPCHILKLYL